MKIHLTGPIKDLVNRDIIDVQFSGDIEQLGKDISRALTGNQKIPFRISVNGRIAEPRSPVKENDRVELITLMQGG